MNAFADALADAGGLAAPRERAGQLRKLAAAELERSARELDRTRSGYPDPVTVLFAVAPDGLLAALPLDLALRADPAAAGDRAWGLAAAALGALTEAGAAPAGLAPARAAPDGAARAPGGAARAAPDGPPGQDAGAGSLLVGSTPGGALVLLALAGPEGEPDAELAALAFEEQVASVDRLRARALAVPAHVLDTAGDYRPPVGRTHPLTVAAHIAALGGRPADPSSADEHEDAVLALLADPGDGVQRPHDDPDPARRAARRILQRLDGMGKWGGYHTEFAHLARGFAPVDQQLAAGVGEALLAAGLLVEKPSVGQRHVFLNPRRAGDVHALIERGELPHGLVL